MPISGRPFKTSIHGRGYFSRMKRGESQDEAMRQVVLTHAIMGGEVGRSVALFDVNFGFPSFPKVFAYVGSVVLVLGLVNSSPLG